MLARALPPFQNTNLPSPPQQLKLRRKNLDFFSQYFCVCAFVDFYDEFMGLVGVCLWVIVCLSVTGQQVVCPDSEGLGDQRCACHLTFHIENSLTMG